MTEVYTSALGMPMKELKRVFAAFTDFAAQHPLSALVTQEQLDTAIAEVCTLMCCARFMLLFRGFDCRLVCMCQPYQRDAGCQPITARS